MRGTFAIAVSFATSENPIMDSGDISLIKGKSLAIAIDAARAVFPDPLGPCNNTLTSGVLAEFFTCSTYNLPSSRIL